MINLKTNKRINLLAPRGTIYIAKTWLPLAVAESETYQFQYIVRPVNSEFDNEYDMPVFFRVKLKKNEFIVLDNDDNGISERIISSGTRESFCFRRATLFEILKGRKELNQ